MKIAVGLPSRGRPLELAAAVLSLWKTRSQGHDVQFLVACDKDDDATFEVCCELRLKHVPLTSMFGPRPVGLGELHNQMVAATEREATFVMWSDRIVPVDMEWDHSIAFAVMQFPQRVLWCDSHHLIGPGQPVLTPGFREALSGPPFPAIYPFWIDDTAVEEIDHLAFGPQRIITAAKCAGPRTAKTNRCREVAFWWSLFAATRPQRVAEAARIRMKLGLAPLDPSAAIAAFEKRDQDMIARAPQLEATFGAGGEPDETYLQAKANAVKIMAEIGIDG